jgi:hypothetical protein
VNLFVPVHAILILHHRKKTQGHKVNIQSWILKFVLPGIVLGTLIYAILSHSTYFNAEVPIDNYNDAEIIPQNPCSPQKGASKQ